MQQFVPRQSHIRRPLGRRFHKNVFEVTMEHPPSRMIWAATSCRGPAGLYFIPPSTTMNGPRYVEFLKQKLQLNMDVHGGAQMLSLTC